MSSLRQLDADQPQTYCPRALLIMRATRYFLKHSITIRSIPCFLARSQSCVSGHRFHLLAPLQLLVHVFSNYMILRSFGPSQPALPAYTEACCELEQYQKTFEPPYSSRPASGFLLVSFSKVTRHLLAPVASTFLAESLPNNAND